MASLSSRMSPLVFACWKRTELKMEKHSSECTPGFNRPGAIGSERTHHSLLVPYEWCEPADFRRPKENCRTCLGTLAYGRCVLDAPLARLADLISWFRLKSLVPFRLRSIRSASFFTVLGPDNSGTLHPMVMEAKATHGTTRRDGALRRRIFIQVRLQQRSLDYCQKSQRRKSCPLPSSATVKI